VRCPAAVHTAGHGAHTDETKENDTLGDEPKFWAGALQEMTIEEEMTFEESRRLGIAVSQGGKTDYQRRLMDQQERSRGSSNLGANIAP